jgi:hypothetical protein
VSPERPKLRTIRIWRPGDTVTGVNGPVYDESGRYVGRTEPEEDRRTLVEWFKQYLVWWLLGWTAFFALALCMVLVFFRGP